MTQREGEFHLLYVDPDPVYRREIPSTFEPEWTVTAAASADAATAAMDGSFDCVVATDELPEMEGLDFFDSLESETDETPFVLFAADDGVDLLRQAFRAGVSDVIYKRESPDMAVDVRPRESTDTTDNNDSSDNTDRVDTTDSTDSSNSTDNSDNTNTTDSTDGIIGLRRCLDSLEIGSTDLNGITLDVSRSLMGAAADEVDMKTEWALQSLAEEIDATQCLIYEVDDGERLELTHGWTDDAVDDSDPHRRLFGIGSEEVPADRFPGFGSQLQQFEPACVDITATDEAVTATDETDSTGGTAAATAINGDRGATAVVSSESTPELPADGDRGTLLALPVVIEWQLLGTIVITVDQPREWGEEARQRLQAVGELVGHMERRRRQRQELERQNEQLEQFASVISHDLQNPLNVISGYLDLAIETGNLDRLDPAVDAADRMEEMLGDLLTLAREGRAVGETQEVDLKPIVTEAWESVETYDGSLELVGVDELGPVEADDSRLQEAFENLFKNAIVHVGKDVDMRVEVDEGTVYVADDGPGIPPDKQDVVFEYGHTGGDGTGLGLAIVRSIIEGHDWEISAAESKEGGARFDIDLGR